MSDKEIIIDNVDVSECKYYCEDEDFCANSNLLNDFNCSKVKDCYYKQLQRLNIIHKNTIEAYTKEIKELKLKIRELKKNLKEE